MSQTLAAPTTTHRMNPVVGFVLLLALAVALLVGFGLRVWTEPSTTRTVPVVVSTPAPASVPASICRVGHPC